MKRSSMLGNLGKQNRERKSKKKRSVGREANTFFNDFFKASEV